MQVGPKKRAVPLTERDQFELLLAPDGGYFFGQIDDTAAVAANCMAAPICLQVGFEVLGKGWGANHIYVQHTNELAEMGYGYIEGYVADVARNYTRIYDDQRGKLRLWMPSHRSKHQGATHRHDRLLVVENRLVMGQQMWTVVTGFRYRTDKKIKGSLLWERSEPASSGSDRTSLASEPSVSAILLSSVSTASGQADESNRTEVQRRLDPSSVIIDQSTQKIKAKRRILEPCSKCGFDLKRLEVVICPQCNTPRQLPK